MNDANELLEERPEGWDQPGAWNSGAAGTAHQRLKDTTMRTQVSTDLTMEMSEALEAPAVADPISQARELVNRFSNGMPIKNWPTGDDMIDSADSATLVLASVGLAIAYHVSRVADALEK